MIKPIMKDVLFLKQKSDTATKADFAVVIDLLDTLKANEANMIGVAKRIIAVNIGFTNIAMINPYIIWKDNPFETEEGCLSLFGVRKTTRYENIEVEYLDINFKKQKQKFTGWTAQIIQHEVDHCDGIII